MKVLFVNCVCGIRSTGRMCEELAQGFAADGHEVRIAYGRLNEVSARSREWAIRIGNRFDLILHFVLTRIFDWHGDRICSYWSTKRFLRWAEMWRPNVLWLHNIHGYYINYELLFKWIKKHPEMQVKWTLHDCWPFTGHCSHFLLTGCDYWKTGCRNCPEKAEYPKSLLFSSAKANWLRKRQAFCDVRRMSLITPSKWLADLTRESFLQDYPVEVVHNSINTTVFNPTPGDFRVRHGLEKRVVILGVSTVWDERKGLPDFFRLRQLLDGRYAIVLVGLSAAQLRNLPAGILGIERTNSARELAEIYSAADWFFNPTREDNYPTVNLEAIACGCRVVTYDIGGCAETVEGCEKAVVLRGAEKTPEGFVKVIRRKGEAA